jgi:hypothetical protein
MVTGALFETPFSVAVTVTVSSFETVDAVAVTLADADPAGTVTVAGKVNLAELSDRLTLKPPPGAAPLRATKHVAEPAEGTLAGLHCNDVSDGPTGVVSVSAAGLEIPP